MSANAIPLRLGPEAISDSLAARVYEGAVVVEAPVATLELAGRGAVQCLQGLFTNDVVGPGGDAFVHGAVLTRFGMIITDCWASRRHGEVVLNPPAVGKDALQEVLAKSFPPRLARVTDRTAETTVLRLVGRRAVAIAEASGIAVPSESHVAVVEVGGAALTVARPTALAPFALQISVATEASSTTRDLLTRAGVEMGGVEALELARVLAGWPALGREVDAKTLPQEVRFDEIGSVSYTKGCYVGQETVARVHFRGRPNRHLRGLLFETEPGPDPSAARGERRVGRVTSVAWVPARRRWIGLAVLRREVDPGTEITAAGVPARVVPLPFALELT